MSIFNNFKKNKFSNDKIIKNSNRDKLKKLYRSKGYKVIPKIPIEDEAAKILSTYSVFTSSLVPKDYMNVTFEDGLIRGEILILWWLNNPRTKKNSRPQYFLYRYGIDFERSLQKLKEFNYINNNNEITKKGFDLLAVRSSIGDEHRMFGGVDSNGKVIYLKSKILKGEEKKKQIYLEAIETIKEQLENFKKYDTKKYIIVGGEHDDEIHLVSEAKIGVNCPPFYIGDTGSIAPYSDPLF